MLWSRVSSQWMVHVSGMWPCDVSHNIVTATEAGSVLTPQPGSGSGVQNESRNIYYYVDFIAVCLLNPKDSHEIVHFSNWLLSGITDIINNTPLENIIAGYITYRDPLWWLQYWQNDQNFQINICLITCIQSALKWDWPAREYFHQYCSSGIEIYPR